MLKKINLGLTLILVGFAFTILGTFFYNYYTKGQTKKIVSKRVEKVMPAKNATFNRSNMTLDIPGKYRITWKGTQIHGDFLNDPSLMVTYKFTNNTGKMVAPSDVFEKYFVLTQANAHGEKTVLSDTDLPDSDKQFYGQNLLDNAQYFRMNQYNMVSGQLYRLESTTNPVYLNVDNKVIRINLNGGSQ